MSICVCVWTLLCAVRRGTAARQKVCSCQVPVFRMSIMFILVGITVKWLLYSYSKHVGGYVNGQFGNLAKMSWVHNVGKIDDFSCFESSSANMKMVSNVGKRIHSSQYDSHHSSNEDNFFDGKRNNNQEGDDERGSEAEDDYNVEDGNRLSIVWHTRSSLYESSVVWKMNIFVKNLPDYFTDKARTRIHEFNRCAQIDSHSISDMEIERYLYMLYSIAY